MGWIHELDDSPFELWGPANWNTWDWRAAGATEAPPLDGPSGGLTPPGPRPSGGLTPPGPRQPLERSSVVSLTDSDGDERPPPPRASGGLTLLPRVPLDQPLDAEGLTFAEVRANRALADLERARIAADNAVAIVNEQRRAAQRRRSSSRDSRYFARRRSRSARPRRPRSSRSRSARPRPALQMPPLPRKALRQAAWPRSDDVSLTDWRRSSRMREQQPKARSSFDVSLTDSDDDDRRYQ